MQFVQETAAAQQGGTMVVHLVSDLVPSIVYVAQHAPYTMAAGEQHLQPGRADSDHVGVQLGARAEGVDEAGGEPVGGGVRIVRGLEALAHVMPDENIARMQAAQFTGGLARLVLLTGVERALTR
ncbi:hypothetical protein [Streptomyces bluensis]|uniref:hypothetical protein n=1 Tax=Streptomyces bluensis TaxID=33897 RepID=UPI003331C1FA